MPDIYFSNGNGSKKNGSDKNDKEWDSRGNSRASASQKSTPQRRKYDETVFTDDDGYEDVYSGNAKKVSSPKKTKKKKRKKRRFIRVIAVLLVLVLVTAGTGAALALSLLNKLTFEDKEEHTNEFVDSSALMSSSAVTNILLIGVDSRSGDTYSRSDTMMLVSLNKHTDKIILTSFMRDMYVDIPGEYSTKINASCAYGGPELVADTIEYNFNIDIDNYILVSFDVFETIVDELGGIEVDVTEAEADYMHGSFVDLPDMQYGEDIHMNGYEALWYSRIRKLDSDFNRTERQRKVIKAILDKALHSSPKALYSAACETLPQVVTDLTKSDIISLGMSLPGYLLGVDVQEQRIPADDTWSYGTRDGSSVIVVDFDANISLLESTIYESGESESESE